MRRRTFIALLAGAAAWPRVARAQGERVRRLGVLIGNAEDDPENAPRIAAFQQGLQKLGWRNGGNIRVDYRFAGGDVELMRKFAAELIALAPDVLIAGNTPTTAALLRQTQNIPTVFVSVSDPIGSGFVKSLANPGGNVTGFITVEPGLGESGYRSSRRSRPRSNESRSSSIRKPLPIPGCSCARPKPPRRHWAWR